jgi:hypothetical protein
MSKGFHNIISTGVRPGCPLYSFLLIISIQHTTKIIAKDKGIYNDNIC